MALGLAVAVADDILDAIGNNSALTTIPIANCFVKLHIGDPGAAGTANVAGNDTRKSISFGAPSGGSMTNDAAITWTTAEVDAAEDYTHFSLWDAVTAGVVKGSGLITGNAVQIADEYTFPIGSFTLAFGVMA
jgi:hypothetical protein